MQNSFHFFTSKSIIVYKPISVYWEFWIMISQCLEDNVMNASCAQTLSRGSRAAEWYNPSGVERAPKHFMNWQSYLYKAAHLMYVEETGFYLEMPQLSWNCLAGLLFEVIGNRNICIHPDEQFGKLNYIE